MSITGSFSTQCRLARFTTFLTLSLLVSLLAVAQVNLRFRMLNGYSFNSEARVNKGRPTLFVFEQAETMSEVFKPVPASNQRPVIPPNFSREMVIGVALPATTTPLALSVSRVFVQDSTLTVRYIRMTDTTQSKASVAKQPTLLLAIPKQTVLKTRLVENGKVVQTIQKRPTE